MRERLVELEDLEEHLGTLQYRRLNSCIRYIDIYFHVCVYVVYLVLGYGSAQVDLVEQDTSEDLFQRLAVVLPEADVLETQLLASVVDVVRRLREKRIISMHDAIASLY